MATDIDAAARAAERIYDKLLHCSPKQRRRHIRNIIRHETGIVQLLEASEQALTHIEAEEVTHGRKFGVGNALRTAIARPKKGNQPVSSAADTAPAAGGLCGLCG